MVERELSLQITIVGMGSLDKSESESDESESEGVDDGELESKRETEWEKGWGFVGARWRELDVGYLVSSSLIISL